MFQIDVKKLLALITVSFFFLVILVLFFVQVPPANLDLLKILVIALLSGASMVLGYYFGSSDGSARKTDLLVPAAVADRVPSTAPIAEAGFIRLPLLAALALIGMLALSACATTGTAPTVNDSPQIIAGKSLLAVKATIITAATATDALCKTGTMAADQCAQALAAYEQAKPAYDAAIDAYLLMTSIGGDPGNFDRTLTRVQGLAANLLTLTGTNRGAK